MEARDSGHYLDLKNSCLISGCMHLMPMINTLRIEAAMKWRYPIIDIYNLTNDLLHYFHSIYESEYTTDKSRYVSKLANDVTPDGIHYHKYVYSIITARLFCIINSCSNTGIM
jgi:hypothetical protein